MMSCTSMVIFCFFCTIVEHGYKFDALNVNQVKNLSYFDIEHAKKYVFDGHE